MALTPASIPAILTAHAAAHGGDIVLRKKDHGIWKATTWSQLNERVREIGLGLKAAGFRPGDVACLLADTRPEWVHIDLAVLGAGGISGGIQPDDESEAVGHALRESRCRVLFVENEEQLDKVLTVRDRCPALQRIVIIDMKGLREFADPMCQSLASFIAPGAATEWDAGIAAITAEQPAIMLLQSGKSHVLTHGDTLHLIANAHSVLPVRPGDERLAFLPMHQMMERVFGLYLALSARAISNYLESPETVIENLQEVKPTVLATDAPFWQALHSRIETAAGGATHLQRLLYRWAIGSGGVLGRLLVLRAVKRELGLSRLRLAYVGGTPPASETERWAAALGITIHRIDGKAAKGSALDGRYQALMQEAYGT